MSLSSSVARIAVPLAALCIAVALPMTASAAPVEHSGDTTAPASAADCYQGDGHSWH
jgi:hypothetical protein